MSWSGMQTGRKTMQIDNDVLLDILRETSYQYRPEGFILKSGRKSTFYIDVRLTALHPMGAKLIGSAMYEAIRHLEPYPHAVAGVAVGGVPLATAISIHSAHRQPVLPAIIVRKAAKDHGADDGSLLVGHRNLPDGHKRVVLVEDVTTTGGSSIRAADVLKAEGFEVSCILTLVDRAEGAREVIGLAGYPFQSIFTRHDFTPGPQTKK